MAAHRVPRPRIRSAATTVSPTACPRAKGNQFGTTKEVRNSRRPGMGLAWAVAIIRLCIQPTPCHFWLAKYSQYRPTVIRKRLAQISFMGVDRDHKVAEGRIRPHAHNPAPAVPGGR